MGKHRELKPVSPFLRKKFNHMSDIPSNLIEMYESKHFLVQVYREEFATRLSINRTSRRGVRWKDGITFDELQSIKSAIGFGGHFAVECYPADHNLINDANMRHLFIVP